MSTLPPIVETVLNEYITLFNKHLPESLTGYISMVQSLLMLTWNTLVISTLLQ